MEGRFCKGRDGYVICIGTDRLGVGGADLFLSRGGSVRMGRGGYNRDRGRSIKGYEADLQGGRSGGSRA